MTHYLRTATSLARSHPRITLAVATAVLSVAAMVWPDLPVDKVTAVVTTLIGM